MALAWVSSRRKRAMLAALDFVSRVFPGLAGNRDRGQLKNEDVKNILVVEPWNIGDIILAIPFLAEVRRKFPAARVTLLARPHAKEVLHGTGLVDSYIETDLGWSEGETRSNPFGYRWLELLRTGAEMRRRRFDLAFKSRMHIREHVLLAVSGAKRRVAFAFGSGDRVLTDPIDINDPDRHKAADWLALLEPFGGAPGLETPKLSLDPEEERWAAEFLTNSGVAADAIVVGLHPGASFAAKRWPLDNFAQVCRALVARHLAVIAFIDPGGYGEQLKEIPGAIAAKVTLRQMIALIARCRLLVCNDSGPMHIAGALGVPAVAVFSSGIPQLFSPLGSGHHLVTREDRAPVTYAAPDESGAYDVAGVPITRVTDAIDSALKSAAIQD